MILTRKRRLETTPQPQERQSQWTTKISIVDDIDDDGCRRRRRRLRMCDDGDVNDERKIITSGDNDDDDDGGGDPENTNLRKPHDEGERWVMMTTMMRMNSRSDYNDDKNESDE